MPRCVAMRVLWMSSASWPGFRPLFMFSISALALVAARCATSANCSSVTPTIGCPLPTSGASSGPGS